MRCTNTYSNVRSLLFISFYDYDDVDATFSRSATLAMNKMRFCIPFPLVCIYVFIYIIFSTPSHRCRTRRCRHQYICRSQAERDFFLYYLLILFLQKKEGTQQKESRISISCVTCINITPNKFFLLLPPHTK